jgi:hypothetical protein
VTDNTSFFNLVNASPILADRMATVSAQVLQSARELYGVQLDHEDVASLGSVRAAVLGAHELDDFRAELESLQKVKDRMGTAPSPGRKPLGPNKSETATLGGVREAQARMNAARNGGEQAAANPAFDPAKASDVEKIRHLMTITDSSLKLTLARRWNLA